MSGRRPVGRSRGGPVVTLGRTLKLLTFFAGLTAWFATREALRRQDSRRRAEEAERIRWETDGGATTAGPQPPGARM